MVQERKLLGPCNNVGNLFMVNFSTTASVQCQTERTSVEPFGSDPTFLRFSSVYDGKARIEELYFEHERIMTNMSLSNKTIQVPIGGVAFYPHSYDPLRSYNGSTERWQHQKPDNLIHRQDRDKFKLYFDERLTAQHANDMVQFIQDAGYIDEKTKKITVEMITFNADLDIVATIKIFIEWENSGRIVWDYALNTFCLSPYKDHTGAIRAGLEILIAVFIFTNVLMEMADFWNHAKVFKGLEYMVDPFNWIGEREGERDCV